MYLMKLPDQVTGIMAQLMEDPTHELADITKLLITKDDPDIVAMWVALESRRFHADDLWVWGFLSDAEKARTLPPYHYKNKADRTELSDKIGKHAKALTRLLKVNNLDVNIIFGLDQIFNGFHLYEDFGGSNRTRIDDADTDKLKFTDLVATVAERATTTIETEPQQGKIGRNARAVRFIRTMGERNYFLYKTALNKIVATATNALFETSYNESAISEILSYFHPPSES